jgi:hypothetical protein
VVVQLHHYCFCDGDDGNEDGDESDDADNDEDNEDNLQYSTLLIKFQVNNWSTTSQSVIIIILAFTSK